MLTAQRSVFGAQFNYAAARYDYVINVLKFRQAVGELSAADIDEVSNWLQNWFEFEPLFRLSLEPNMDASGSLLTRLIGGFFLGAVL